MKPTRVHGFATKTKALAREIPPVTQVTFHAINNFVFSLNRVSFLGFGP